MSNTLECPECGRDYPHEKRLAGRPVQCRHCGHRFLAPAWSATVVPPSSKPAAPSPGVRSVPNAARRQPPARAAAEDEVLDAEVVAEPVYPALLETPPAVPAERVLPAPRVTTAPARLRPAATRPQTGGGPRGSGPIIAVAVSTVAALAVVAALGIWMWTSRATPRGAPPPSGEAITVWNASCTGLGGAQTTFTLDYRLDTFKPEAGKTYSWVVVGPAGEVKFPLAELRALGKLNGPVDTSGGAIQGPLTTHIESEPAAGVAAQRISNSVPVEIK